MAGETTTAASTTSIGTSIPTLIDAALIAEVRDNTIMLPFVDLRDTSMLPGLAMSFPRLSTAPSVSAITSGTAEADAQSATTLVTAVATATAASKAGHVLQSWLSMAGSAVNWEVEVPAALGRALAQLIDSDAASLLSGFSNTVGTTGVDATLEDLRAASVLFRRTALGASDSGVFVLHPQQLGDVDGQLLSGSGAGLSPMLGREDLINLYGMAPGSGMLKSYRGTLFGIPVFQTTNVPDVNTAADHGGALFAPQLAIGGVYKWLGKLVRASQASNLKLADSWQISAAYAFVEKFDSMGVSVITDHA